MSQFHENIRTIFEDVERFLIVQIKPLTRNLSYEGRLQREKILAAIHELKVAYPALDNIGACAEFTEGGGDTDRSRSTLQSDAGFSSNSQRSCSGTENRSKGNTSSSSADCKKVIGGGGGKKGFNKSAFTSKKNLLAAIFLSRSTLSLHPKKLAANATAVSADDEVTTLALIRSPPPLVDMSQVNVKQQHIGLENSIAVSDEIQAELTKSEALPDEDDVGQGNMINRPLEESTEVNPPKPQKGSYVSGSSSGSSLTSIKDTYTSNESACFDPGRDFDAAHQILISGYLEKRKKGADGLKGALLNRFQTKWCVVVPQKFLIYDRRCDKKAKKCLTLCDYEFHYPSPLIICQEARYRSFVLEGNGNLRGYHLLGESRRSVKEWKDAFHLAQRYSINKEIPTSHDNNQFNATPIPSMTPPTGHTTDPALGDTTTSPHQTPSKCDARPSPQPQNSPRLSHSSSRSNSSELLHSHLHNATLLKQSGYRPFTDAEYQTTEPMSANSPTTSPFNNDRFGSRSESCSPEAPTNIDPDLIMSEYIERIGCRLNSAAQNGISSPSLGHDFKKDFSPENNDLYAVAQMASPFQSPKAPTKREQENQQTTKSFSEGEWRDPLLNTSLDSCQSFPHKPQNASKSHKNRPECFKQSLQQRQQHYFNKNYPLSNVDNLEEKFLSVMSRLGKPNHSHSTEQGINDLGSLLVPERIYLAKQSCQPDGPDELELYYSDPVYVISKRYDEVGWWIAISLHEGALGLVPKCYLTPAYCPTSASSTSVAQLVHTRP